MDVCDSLRQAREQRHLSIDDVARATRISARTIAAIEAGRFERLPGGFYTRSMLRACAREVGLDPEQTVGAYLGEVEHQVPTPVRSATVASAERPTAHLTFSSPIQWFLRAVDPTWSIGAVALIAIWMLYPSSGSDSPLASDPMATSSATSAVEPASAEPGVEADRPVGTAGSQDDVGVLGMTGEDLRVEIRATDECWVSAVADEQRVVYRTLQRGETATLNVRDQLVLRVGNPAAFSFTMNGREGRPLGDGREPVTLRVTPQTYRDVTVP